MKSKLESLIEQGMIERVPDDMDIARARLVEAKRHLVSAEVIVAEDADGAYVLLYDAARKAVGAHMLAHGYRPKMDRPGAHRAIVLYAEAILSEHAELHVSNFDRMRRTRNRSEYGSRVIGGAEVSADLDHARGLVSAVERLLP